MTAPDDLTTDEMVRERIYSGLRNGDAPVQYVIAWAILQLAEAISDINDKIPSDDPARGLK